jgi:MFS family permease
MELLTRLETLNGTGKFTYICVAFMLMFTAFNTAQNLIPVLFEQLGYAALGKICLFSCYGLFSFGSVLASDLVQKWGYVKSMFYCGLAYMGCFSLGTLLTACEYYNTSFGYCDNTALVVASNVAIFAVGGFLSAVLWTAVSGYVAAIATDNDQKAKFYGLLFTAVNSSFVIGSIFSSILLRIWSKYAYFLLLSTLGGAATVMYYFIPFVPVKTPVEEDSGRKSSVGSDQELLVGKIFHNGEPVKKFELKPLGREDHDFEGNHNVGVNPMYQQEEERTERILSAPLIDKTEIGSHHEDGAKPSKSKSINDNFQVIFGLMKSRKVRPWLWVMALSGSFGLFIHGPLPIRQGFPQRGRLRHQSRHGP